MSVIDKKGKIFGKLNIIDLIAIILIVAVLALVGYKFVNRGNGPAGEGVPVVYTVAVDNVDADVYEFIQADLAENNQLTAASEMLEGYITDLQATPAEKDSYQMVLGSDNTVQPQLKAGTYDLVFTIEATVKDNLTSELGTQEIRVGKTHIVKTTTFELDKGVITSCERPAAEEAAQ